MVLGEKLWTGKGRRRLRRVVGSQGGLLWGLKAGGGWSLVMGVSMQRNCTQQ